MALDLPADSGALGALAPPGRCPACAGAVRSDAPWCTQCWTDLRAPAPAPEPPGPPVRPVPVDDPGDDPGDVPGRPGWPCSCGARNAPDEDACPTCGAGLFDALRGEGTVLLAVPVLGDVAHLTKVQLGLAAAALLPVLVAVLLVVLALAGALLT